jgi:hypothetical protein
MLGSMTDEISSRGAFPMPEVADKGHQVAKAVLSAVPYVGGSAAELMSFVIAPPLERRRTNWLNGLAVQLSELEQKVAGFSVTALAEDPGFISAVTEATRSALSTHDAEKLDALRNAVANVALGGIDDDVAAAKLNMLTQLTPLHLRVLKFFDAPKAFSEARGRPFDKNWHMLPLSQVVLHAVQELAGSDLLRPIVSDLSRQGLIGVGVDVLSTMMSAHSATEPRTTDLGKAILRLAAAPR